MADLEQAARYCTNTEWTLAWMDRMREATGYCGAVLAEALASLSDDDDRAAPTDTDIERAQAWERDPTLFVNTVRRSGRWCCTPTAGCLRTCDKWKDFDAPQE